MSASYEEAGASITAGAAAADDGAQRLLQLIGQFVAESRPQGAAAITLDSSFERDLGIDSLGRAELLLRTERAFNVSLPEHALTGAETPRDLLRFVLTAHAPSAAVERAVRVLTVATDESFPHDATTLIEVLEWHVAKHPDRLQIHFYDEDEREHDVSYAALMAGAQAYAAGLVERGIEAGQTVAIMLPTGLEYFYSFYGILLAGGVPVPIYPPLRLAQLEEHMHRHGAILANAQVVALITVPEAKAVALLLRSQVPSLLSVITPGEFDPVSANCNCGRASALTRSHSCNTPRARRAIRKASCSRTRTCWPTCARWARRCTPPAATCS